MFVSAIPVLGPLMVAMGLWLLPVDASIETCVSLLVVWTVITFFLVRRMSRPGGRLLLGTGLLAFGVTKLKSLVSQSGPPALRVRTVS